MTHKITIEAVNESYQVEHDDVILDAGLDKGYNLPHSCRGGACGCCRANLIEGEINYLFEPIALSDEERAQNIILPCACVATTDVALNFIDGDVQSIMTKAPKVQQLPVKVSEIEVFGEDLAIVKLAVPKTKTFEFNAGQYIDFLMRDGKRRSFSIANHRQASEGNGAIELHIRMIPDGRFTPRFFYGSIKRGDIMKIAGPYGNFTLQKSHRPILFLAGGTGVAPIKGIIEKALDEDYRVPMTLYWGVRYEKDLYLHELLLSWQEKYDFFHYIPVISRPDEGGDSPWQGKSGYAYQSAIADIGNDFSSYDVYTSGRPAFVDDTKAALLEYKLSEDHYYFDAFEYAVN